MTNHRKIHIGVIFGGRSGEHEVSLRSARSVMAALDPAKYEVTPIVARATRDAGALTIGVVTRPFTFEGSQRSRSAEAGIEQLKEHVDTLIVIPNDRLLETADKRVSLLDSFRMADDILRQGIQGISELITVPGLINLDFADVKTIMSMGGAALMACLLYTSRCV